MSAAFLFCKGDLVSKKRDIHDHRVVIGVLKFRIDRFHVVHLDVRRYQEAIDNIQLCIFPASAVGPVQKTRSGYGVVEEEVESFGKG